MSRLTAIVVNYNCASYTGSCVRSLRRQAMPESYGREISIVVVDNASPRPGERERLDALRAEGAEVVMSAENEGYAGGVARGLERARGDRILVVNPDAQLLESALVRLAEALERDPRAAASGPKGYLDPGREILLPPNVPAPTLADFVYQSAGLLSRPIGRAYSLRRSRLAVRYWRQVETVEYPMLSGACLLVRKEAIDRIGFLDPRFPLYYEDSDWFFRVRKAGLRLLYVPRAEMVHFYAKSSATHHSEAQRRLAVAQPAFFRKHYGRAGLAVYSLCKRTVARHGARFTGWDYSPWTDLGDVDVPPSFRAPARGGRVLFELGTSPTFSLTVGAFADGPAYRLGASAWSVLEPIEYWARLLDLDRGSILGTWRFQKTTHATAVGLVEEVEATAPGGRKVS